MEALRGDGSPLCSLPPLPDDRYFHTQSGLLTCGGDTSPTSCLTLTQGGNMEGPNNEREYILFAP